MSVLEDFYDGKVQPYENITVRDPGHDPIEEKIADERENWLRKLLSEKDYERYEKLESLYHDSATWWERKHFVYGFRLGALMMTEVLTGTEDLFKGT